VKALAPQHPEWKDKEPFASLLKGDLKTAFAGNPGNGDIGSTKVRARRLPSLLALRDANELDQPTHRRQPAFPYRILSSVAPLARSASIALLEAGAEQELLSSDVGCESRAIRFALRYP
jgi:hypothetical protein